MNYFNQWRYDMSVGSWIDVISSNEVLKVRQIVLTDSSTSSLKEYLVFRFYKVLNNKAVSFQSFDEESTEILINLILANSEDQNFIYSILKMYVYHTYMAVFHQMKDEYRLLRYKLHKITDPNAVY